MKTFFSQLVIVAILVSCISCAHKVADIKTEQAIKWDSKAVLINKRDKKQQNLNITLIGIRRERLRMEITAMLGYQVGSIVADRNTFKALIVPQKIFYEGTSSTEALYKLVQIPLEPLQILHVAFDEHLGGSGWICQQGGDGLISRCDHHDLGLNIAWSERKEGRKLVVITSSQFEMRWLLESPESAVDLKPTVFELTSPDGFKNVQLN